MCVQLRLHGEGVEAVLGAAEGGGGGFGEEEGGGVGGLVQRPKAMEGWGGEQSGGGHCGGEMGVD